MFIIVCSQHGFFQFVCAHPFACPCRCANLPDSLSTLPSNVHLALLSANEHYVLDEASGALRRRIRAPKSLLPHLTVLVDDLLAAYTKGVVAADTSIGAGQADHLFRCRVMLLFWTGDYPAQALSSGTHSKTCHWCTHKSVHAPEVNRRCWCDYRRFLPADHELRMHARYGAPETRPPPDPRTHAGFVADAVENVTHRGFKKDAPYKRSGVKELSPLGALPMFNLVWDILPDMMHIIPGVWARHIFGMFNGERTPARPKQRKKFTDAENRELQKQHEDALKHLASWTLTQEQKDTMDQRSMDLGGEPNWIRNNVGICSHASSLNSHDWMLLIQSAGHYLPHNLFPEEPDKQECLLTLLDACNRCLTTTSAYDSENREVIDQVKQAVVVALCKVEACMPRTELPVMFHVLLHVPDAIYRWNSVRNFWAFFGERSALLHFDLSSICIFFPFRTCSLLDMYIFLFTFLLFC